MDNDITPESSIVPVYLDPTPLEPIDDSLPAPDTAELRRSSYQLESDPLFFKWQRGEATEQEWLDKVQEINTRYRSIDG